MQNAKGLERKAFIRTLNQIYSCYNDSCKTSHQSLFSIPVSEQLVEEIWISSRELDNWKSLLRPLYKIRNKSPFMQYTEAEILNMPRCEFNRIIKWIEYIYGLINRLTAVPTDKIEYELRPYSDSQCPDVSDKGRNLQRLRLKSPKPLGPSDEYRYNHHFRGEIIYSIPTKFLP